MCRICLKQFNCLQLCLLSHCFLTKPFIADHQSVEHASGRSSVQFPSLLVFPLSHSSCYLPEYASPPSYSSDFLSFSPSPVSWPGTVGHIANMFTLPVQTICLVVSLQPLTIITTKQIWCFTHAARPGHVHIICFTIYVSK